MDLREHWNLKITAIIGLVSLGIAIVAFSQPVVTSLETEKRHRDSFDSALFLEVSRNSGVLTQAVDEYKDGGKFLTVPTLSSTAYEALLNSGMLDSYSNKTGYDLVTLYMQITKSENVFNSSQSDYDKAYSAKSTLSYIDDYRNGFEKSNILELEINHYQLWLAVGSMFVLIGSGWLLLEYYLPQIISVSRFFGKLTRLFRRKRK